MGEKRTTREVLEAGGTASAKDGNGFDIFHLGVYDNVGNLET